MLQNRISGIDRDLVISCVAVLHTKVVVLKIDVEVRHDETVLDELPNDARHLIAIEFDDCIFNLDLCHESTSFFVSAMCRISLVSDLYTIAFRASLRSTIVSNGF